MITKTQINALVKTFPQTTFSEDSPLSQVSYFKIGGAARLLCSIHDAEEMISLIRYCRDQDIPFVVLGEASNVIISDSGVDKLVVLVNNREFNIIKNDLVSLTQDEVNQGLLVRVGAGLKTGELVTKTVNLGLTGLEPFFGIPGRVGGAVYNNSHFQKELIGDYVKRVRVVNPDKSVSWIDQKDCQFAYDYSRFQQSNEVIIQIDLFLKHGDKRQSKQLIKDSTLYRVQTQPLSLPSSGCIFKNVKNTARLQKIFPQFRGKEYLSAGFIIDQAGLKGLRSGEIEVSQVHAAFMVNHGGGTAKDIFRLISQVKKEVKKKFDVSLEEEVFFIE